MMDSTWPASDVCYCIDKSGVTMGCTEDEEIGL